MAVPRRSITTMVTFRLADGTCRNASQYVMSFTGCCSPPSSSFTTTPAGDAAAVAASDDER
eukprot:CAMPEP_0176461846 /NCGR_PEP_ID=MMETSP0127-20121128/34899_1 /TAXON_ID=938130 /ORGANISM="Platyophrya macrostoma, Strain WH" /LENGTH=60 /DNA_ID=CAMNT_0017853619 /DNA_START=360 /DNA_END=539 /DNA_ORIENTATION=+